MTALHRGKVAGPLCPKCESTSTRCRATGYGHDDERIRYRNCLDCKFYFLTVEVPITGVTWGEVIANARPNDRARHYERFGHHPRPELRKPIATLDVKVTVRRVAPRAVA